MKYFNDFFDPYNMEHIKAYKYLSATGSWPDGFIPEDITLLPNWQSWVAFILADAWIEQVLAGNVIGMPPIEHTE